jgi:hypothetical protein
VLLDPGVSRSAIFRTEPEKTTVVLPRPWTSNPQSTFGNPKSAERSLAVILFANGAAGKLFFAQSGKPRDWGLTIDERGLTIGDCRSNPPFVV